MSLLEDAKKKSKADGINRRNQEDIEIAYQNAQKTKIDQLCHPFLVEILELTNEIEHSKPEIKYIEVWSSGKKFLLDNLKDNSTGHRYLYAYIVNIPKFKTKIYITLDYDEKVIVGLRETGHNGHEYGNHYDLIQRWFQSDQIKTDFREKLVNLISEYL